MTLRDDQVALTHKAIIDAVIELSGQPDSGPITVTAVSRLSGVSPATIYRHFPSRDALVAGAANARLMSGVGAGMESWGTKELRDHLLALWSELAGNLPLTRQAAVSEAGRELRKARFDRFNTSSDRALREAGLDPASETARAFKAGLDVMTSVHAFLDLHDRQGLTPEQCVETAMGAVELLLRGVGIDPAAYRLPLSEFAPEGESAET